MTTLLDEVLARINGLDPKARAALVKETDKLFAKAKWIPTAGPQADAFYCQADVLGYGGQGGGGKTDLILGLAFTQHRRSLIVRRRYTDLSAILERAIQINGTRKGYSGQVPPTLRTGDGRLLEFGACAIAGDEESWQGRPHDLLAIDESTQLLESQVRFLMGWVRSTDKGQRTRVILATNPPLTAEGQWFFEMFRPWVDENYPDRAKPGELRWYVTNEDGKDMIVDGPDPVKVGSKTYRPMSRTFIPAALGDNPFLSVTDYQSKLDALPEPLRSAVRDGSFNAGRRDDLWQLIPSQWIIEAQRRWTAKPPDHAPMCSMGVDVAQGGPDETVIATRYDGWYDKLISAPGKDTPRGSDVAALIVKYRKNSATVIIDMGGGYGGAAMESLAGNGIQAYGHKGAEKSAARTKDRQLGFFNKRAEVHWKFREALDPDQDGGSPIALPPDNTLFSDLVAAKYEVTSRGIKVEEKEEIVARLGRSPDRGDAVIIAWSKGASTPTHGQIWRQAIKTSFRPSVILGHEKQRRR